ncbi:hypothetical protein [Micromonospora sp. URMC 103]|uniref:hypothetical protein n=1 Tax=Micromonospora sp. URMC 103 TaxID=3423406 RepID=UPI003F1B95C6
MAGDRGSGAATRELLAATRELLAATRELLLVLALAAAGLLLAVVAAFTPWHATVAGTAPAGVVDLHVPVDPDSAPGGLPVG